MGRGWWVVVLIRHAREHKFVLTNRVRTVRRTREDEDRERHRKCLRGAASTETVRARAPGPVAERSCSTLSRRHVAWRRGVVAVASSKWRHGSKWAPLSDRNPRGTQRLPRFDTPPRRLSSLIDEADARSRKAEEACCTSNGRHVTRVMSRYGLRNVRLGEASCPGPCLSCGACASQVRSSRGEPVRQWPTLMQSEGT